MVACEENIIGVFRRAAGTPMTSSSRSIAVTPARWRGSCSVDIANSKDQLKEGANIWGRAPTMIRVWHLQHERLKYVGVELALANSGIQLWCPAA